MNSFTISQLQDYSGIKAHTIRIWEQRYNALQPDRSEGNTRSYSGDQLRRLLNITSLLNKSFKISQLASLTDKELSALIDEHFFKASAPLKNDANIFISQLLAATFDFDEAHFERIFSNCILQYGLRDAYLQVLHPTLVRLGLLWSKDELPPAHEHFIVNLIRKKILAAIANLPPAQPDSKSWLLFLPEDEFHDTGLLMAHFLISNAGHKVYYLGANLPFASLHQSIEMIQPTHVLGFLVSKKNKEEAVQAIDSMCVEFKNTKFFNASNWNESNNYIANARFTKLSSVSQLEALLG